MSGGETEFQSVSTASNIRHVALTDDAKEAVNQLLNSAEIDQVLDVLQFLASIANNQQNLQPQLLALMPKLAPLFASELNIPVVQSANVINAFVTALPIVDFTQDNLPQTLDKVLIRLLNDAEADANAEDKNKILRARNIIMMADFNVVGLTVIYETDENGKNINKNHPKAIKQVLNDGTSRELLFSYDDAIPSILKEFYPAKHSEFKPDRADLNKGSLTETAQFKVLDGFDFTTLTEAVKKQLI